MKIILNDPDTGKKIIPVPNFLIFSKMNKYLSKKGAKAISSRDIERIKRILNKYSSQKEEFVLVDICDKDGSGVKIML